MKYNIGEKQGRWNSFALFLIIDTLFKFLINMIYYNII